MGKLEVAKLTYSTELSGLAARLFNIEAIAYTLLYK